MKTLGNLNAEDLAGRIALLRIDSSVPFETPEKVWDHKLRAGLASLDLLMSAKARVVVLSHVDAEDPREAQRAAYRRLAALFGRPMSFLDDCRGTRVLKAVTSLRAGEAILLGNLSREPAEQANTREFARFFADLCEVYCNDAFTLAHEVRASTVGVASIAGCAAAGLAFERELCNLGDILDRPLRPFLVVFGGALSTSRLLLLEAICARADVVLVGGEISLAFLEAQGLSAGAHSSNEAVEIAARILANFRTSNRLVLPEDLVYLEAPEIWRPGPGGRRVIGSNLCGKIAGDIGIGTLLSWSEQLGRARTVLWHGPLGVCEDPRLRAGTMFFADQMAARTWPSLHKTIACGESLTAVLRGSGFRSERILHLSPAGTSILRYAAGWPLPGLDALENAGARQLRKPSIVVALAGEEEDFPVASFAGGCFGETCELHCIYVEAGPDEEEYPDIYHAMPQQERWAERQEAQRVFARADAAFASQGIMPASRAVVHGNPSHRLIRHARELNAEVIVMTGNAGKNRKYSEEQVMANAPCEVLVFPQHSEGRKT